MRVGLIIERRGNREWRQLSEIGRFEDLEVARRFSGKEVHKNFAKPRSLSFDASTEALANARTPERTRFGGLIIGGEANVKMRAFNYG